MPDPRPRSESRQRRKIVAIRVNPQEQAILRAEMRRTGKPAAALFRAAFFEAIAGRASNEQ